MAESSPERYPRRERDACPPVQGIPGEQDKEQDGFCFAHILERDTRIDGSSPGALPTLKTGADVLLGHTDGVSGWERQP
jgi:hypothetical protein